MNSDERSDEINRVMRKLSHFKCLCGFEIAKDPDNASYILIAKNDINSFVVSRSHMMNIESLANNDTKVDKKDALKWLGDMMSNINKQGYVFKCPKCERLLLYGLSNEYPLGLYTKENWDG